MLERTGTTLSFTPGEKKPPGDQSINGRKPLMVAATKVSYTQRTCGNPQEVLQPKIPLDVGSSALEATEKLQALENNQRQMNNPLTD